MFDLFLRMLLHPRDYWGMLNRETLIFKERIDEGNDYYSFLFNCADSLRWKAGQHGIFTLPEKTVTGKSWRAFSIASSPIENEIRIGTSIPPATSDFKQKLLALEAGDRMNLRGPFGEFHLRNTQKQIVAVVGGIGITPLRAIMIEVANDLHPDIQLELIYAGKDDYFTYSDACHEFADHPQISITFVNTPDEVNAALDTAIETHHNQASYFISGSPGMIQAIRKRLQAANINKITNDPFKGY